jgi:hypothetical protein
MPTHTRYATYGGKVKELRRLDEGWRRATIGLPNKRFFESVWPVANLG